MSVFGSILCRFGRHRPRLPGTWNQGYGFTTCQRCYRDLVRPLMNNWRVPKKGFAVVWRKPANAAELSLPERVLAEQLAAAPRASLPNEQPPMEQLTDAAAEAAAPARLLELPKRSPFDFGDFDAPDLDATFESAMPVALPRHGAQPTLERSPRKKGR